MGLTFRMEFLAILTILLSLLACQAKIKDASSSLSSTLSYWNHKLPNTPFPSALLGRLSTLEANRLAYPNHTRNKIEAVLRPYIGYSKAFNRKGQMTTEPSGTIFFLEKKLGIGKKVTVDLALWKIPETLYFIPADVANEIPFSTKSLFVSLDKLHIPPDSVLAVTMKETLEECERSVMIGESKKCVTSLESMIDYTTSELGTNDVNVSITNVSKIPTSGKKQYTIASIPFESKSTSTLVVCHTIEYAYLVYFCHNIKDTRMFQLSLKTDEGNSAEIVAICHEDTSAWSPEHVSFKMLNVKPGGEAICHFIPEDGIVWVAAN